MDIDRGQDDDGMRWYFVRPDDDSATAADGVTIAPSVTTVLKFLEEDTTGLETWQSRNDGSGDSPHHEHLFWYSGPRGTLCHYDALSTFEDQFDGDEMWGEEEAESMAKIISGPADESFDDASTALDDVTYSVLRDKGVVSNREQFDVVAQSTRLVDVLEEDRDWFEDAFAEACETLGVGEDDIVAVEKFLLSPDGYGGQCDMLYRDASGNVVVADLKTSGSLRQKHRLQGVAYAHAVEEADDLPDTVDRTEVWRMDPDERAWTVHAPTVPDHVDDDDLPRSGDYSDDHWFVDNWGDFSYDGEDDMWETFTDLVDEAADEISAEVDDVSTADTE